VERKKTWLWKPKAPFAVEALFFLGVLFAVGGLERVGILKAFVPVELMGGKGRVTRDWDEISKISGSS